MRIDDETLVAYLDAQLESDADYERVEEALAQSSVLRVRLQALAESAERARRAFDAKLEEAVPPQLIAAIMNAPLPDADAPSPAQAASLTGRSLRPPSPSLGERLAAWLGQGFGGATAFASLVTLVMGALIGHYLLPASDAPRAVAELRLQPGDAIRDAVLAVVLQTAPSGLALDVGDRRVEVMASFADRDGRLCREYSVSQAVPTSRYEVAVACRGDGALTNGWQLAFVVDEVRTPGGDAGYVTASDRLHEAVDRFMGEHIADGPLDAEAERRLIERGWVR